MEKRYLTDWERDLIALYKAQGISHYCIAEKIGRDRRTVDREVARNSWKGKYLACMAGYLANLRKRKAGERTKRMDRPEIRKYIVDKLKIRWSPEIISEIIKRSHLGFTISTETIYKFVYDNSIDFSEYLIRKHKYRRRKNRYSKRRDRIPNRVSINKRSDTINNREEFGHFESDSVVSKQNNAGLNVLVERKSRYTLITKINDQSSETTCKAIIGCLSEIPSEKCRSITYDNGSENFKHQEINDILNMVSFFCDSYKSWQKGTVENTNGLIRVFLPKGTNFRETPEEQIKYIENWLNDRPRKCLNYKTPRQVFFELGGAIPP